MRLVILLLDIKRIRTTKVVTSTKVEEMKTTRIIEIKAKSAILPKKMFQMNMMMKLFMLQ